MSEDPVNSPAHYTGNGEECIDYIQRALGDAGFIAFCQGNSIKYRWRAGLKGNRTQDHAKARWYERMAVGDDPRKDTP